MPDDAQPTTNARIENMKRAREKQFAEWFETRHWRVAEETNGLRTREGITILYDHGEFWVQHPGVFKTPLGHRGKRGFLVKETDADGKDLDPASVQAFGHLTLKTAGEKYGTIHGLPAEPRKEPPEELLEQLDPPHPDSDDPPGQTG
jgi:hypothetical protein